MNRRSLRRRLAAGGLAAITVALIAAGFGLLVLFERHATRAVLDDLDVLLRQLAAGVELDAAGRLQVVRPPADPRFADPLSGLYWQAELAGAELPGAGRIRSRSLWDTDMPLGDDRPGAGEVHRHHLPGPGGQRLVVVERLVTLPQAVAVRLAVAADRARIERAGRDFAVDLVPGLALLALLLGFAAWVQIGLGLAPLAELRRGIAAIRDGGRERLSGAVPAEVQPLVEEVNALLDSQSAGMARAERRAADLAHGLKTPLAALAADARRLREAGQGAIADDLDALGDSMRRHIERELVRVRLLGRATDRRGVSTGLADLVGALVATLTRTPEGERVEFQVDIAPDQSAPLERADLAEILGNLLENAARHARRTVRIRAEGGRSASAIVVEDDGPGLPVAAYDQVMQPGIRLDERGGAGLGLAIAQDVAEAYGWRIELAASPLGGLAVTLAQRGPAPIG